MWDQEPFMFQGKTYKSHEHALQSSKFRVNGYYDVADSFAIESRSKLRQSSGLGARKARKKINLSSEELEKWKSSIDRIKDEIQNYSFECKYTQCPTANKALKYTLNAQLISGVPRMKKIRCLRLEKTRKIIQNYKLSK